MMSLVEVFFLDQMIATGKNRDPSERTSDSPTSSLSSDGMVQSDR